MRRINIEEPRFTQADVLKLVLGLTERTLQNWAQRKLLDESNATKPGKGAERLYSALGVVALKFMLALTDLGVPPRATRQLVDEVAHAVLELHRTYPTKGESDGRLNWMIPNTQSLRRAYITADGRGGFRVQIESLDPNAIEQLKASDAFIVVQFDTLCLAAFSRIYGFIAALSDEEN